ncbi:MAG: response regulator [Actinobacteria bacterium]|nr:response regulator [Actinomycetota bacterium]
MSLNILIVDDSAVIRKMIIKTLGLSALPLGEVCEAGNGQEALDIMDRQWIDLVFADLNMPVMDGEVMIEKIRSNPEWADVPIIVVSTEGSRTRIERLQSQGVRFVHKPFSPEQICRVVDNLLELCHEE